MGAKAAGLRCYWANRRGAPLFDPTYAPDHMGPDLTGLLDILLLPHLKGGSRYQARVSGGEPPAFPGATT
ncbi:MAG: hypothetical protein Q9O62_13110 [Ardenticatenia bacterium]|nr:hypothetical protein [Ardenticatenia bacterium]